MYQERSSRLDGAVVWSRTDAVAGTARVLPDGCMDLLFRNGRLAIAGPDSQAHLFETEAGESITGLRFAPGTGPAVFGVRADELRDQRIPLGDVWPEHEVRLLEQRAAGTPSPGTVLEEAAARRLPRSDTDPVGAAILGMARRGRGVTATARAVGLSERQLHRRCLAAFGYGAKTLARVLRMRRALALADGGMPLVEVAAVAGYADQSHLAREVRVLAGAPVTRLIRSARPRGRP